MIVGIIPICENLPEITPETIISQEAKTSKFDIC